MIDGRREEDWLKVSFIVAKIHNSFASKTSQLKGPDFFNPMAGLRRREPFQPATADKVRQVGEFLRT